MRQAAAKIVCPERVGQAAAFRRPAIAVLRPWVLAPLLAAGGGAAACNALMGFESGSAQPVATGGAAGSAGSAGAAGSGIGAGGTGTGGGGGGAAAPEIEWARLGRSAGDDVAWSVAADGNGPVIVVGQHAGGIDLGCGALPSNGTTDGFVASFSAAGSCVWQRTLTGTGTHYALDVATDTSGNVFVAGQFTGDIDCGSGSVSSTGSADTFVAKYSATGSHLWSRFITGSADQWPLDITTDNNQDVFVVGAFYGTSDFGGGDTTNQGGMDGFLVKIAATGQFRWAQTFGGSGNDTFRAVVSRPLGTVQVAGEFSDTVSWGGTPYTATSAEGDIFVAAYSSDGLPLGSTAFNDTGPASVCRARAMALGPAGETLVSGFLAGNIDLGGGDLITSNTSDQDLILVAFGADGVHQWSHSYGDGARQEGNAVAVGDGGRFVHAGVFAGSLDLGAGPLPSAAGQDAFVAKHESDGTPIWQAALGGSGDQIAWGVAVSSAERTVVVGQFDGRIQLGNDQVDSQGGTDLFVVQYEP